MSKELLKIAADQIEALSADLAKAQTKIAELETVAAKATAKVAEDVKVAEEAKAKIVDLAKVASAKLSSVGLLPAGERADALTAKLISSPETALETIAKVAEYVKAPGLGTVVEEGSTTESADAGWDRRVAAGLKA